MAAVYIHGLICCPVKVVQFAIVFKGFIGEHNVTIPFFWVHGNYIKFLAFQS